MEFLEIDGQRYEAEFVEYVDYGEFYGSKVCKVTAPELSYEQARNLLHDDVEWFRVVIYDVEEEDGIRRQQENKIDMSDLDTFEKAEVSRAEITTITMRETSDLEQAYELLYGGIN